MRVRRGALPCVQRGGVPAVWRSAWRAYQHLPHLLPSPPPPPLRPPHASSSLRSRRSLRTASGETAAAAIGGRERLDAELARISGKEQTSVTLKATVDTGLGLMLPTKEDPSGNDSR